MLVCCTQRSEGRGRTPVAWTTCKVSDTSNPLRSAEHPSHLNISAACHLDEVLLLLQSFVNLVICHAEAPQSGFNGIMRLCEDDKLGHVRHTDDLSVHLSGEMNRFLHLPTVDQPEPGGQRGLGNTAVRSASESVQITETTDIVSCYLADTLVVKETQSLMNVSGVVPVMSSH